MTSNVTPSMEEKLNLHTDQLNLHTDLLTKILTQLSCILMGSAIPTEVTHTVNNDAAIAALQADIATLKSERLAEALSAQASQEQLRNQLYDAQRREKDLLAKLLSLEHLAKPLETNADTKVQADADEPSEEIATDDATTIQTNTDLNAADTTVPLAAVSNNMPHLTIEHLEEVEEQGEEAEEEVEVQPMNEWLTDNFTQIPKQFQSRDNTAACLMQSWRSRNNDHTFTFRANFADLEEGSSRLVSIHSKDPRMTCGQFISALAASIQLPTDVASFNLVMYSSGLVLSPEEQIDYRNHLTIYAKVKKQTVKVSVDGRDFDFFIDAKLGNVCATLINTLPNLAGKPLWWEGIDISDSCYMGVRLGQLCMVTRRYSPNIMDLLKVLSGEPEEEEEEEPEEFTHALEDNDDAENFFTDDDADENEKGSSQPQRKNDDDDQLSLAFTGDEGFESKLLRVHFHENDADPLEVSVLSLAENGIAGPAVIFLSLFLALPPCLVVPALRMGAFEDATPGSITIASQPSAMTVDVLVHPYRKYSVWLADRYEFDDNCLSVVPASDTPVNFFTPVKDTLLTVSDADVTICKRVSDVISAETTGHKFNTKEEAENVGDATYVHFVASIVAAYNSSLSILCYPPDATGEIM